MSFLKLPQSDGLIERLVHQKLSLFI